jgi:hypothetical protein
MVILIMFFILIFDIILNMIVLWLWRGITNRIIISKRLTFWTLILTIIIRKNLFRIFRWLCLIFYWIVALLIFFKWVVNTIILLFYTLNYDRYFLFYLHILLWLINIYTFFFLIFVFLSIFWTYTKYILNHFHENVIFFFFFYFFFLLDSLILLIYFWLIYLLFIISSLFYYNNIFIS